MFKRDSKIENEPDIKFYNFFITNHQEYSMFRDNYHPTKNMLEYIGSEIMKKLNKQFNINYNIKYYGESCLYTNSMHEIMYYLLLR